ncbi:hypothetical protein ACLE20_04720 [Rhizobium sp. YIM 134829]|uniref:hypothetical protein n=1 Tax=Rhizobium sp. YIM 134829 TaxID=3390453 RepID=UPI00397C526D
MPNKPVPAAAEGMPTDARVMNSYLEAADLIYEVRQHAGLIGMALDSISLDRELSAIAGGITTLQRKIEQLEQTMERARVPSRTTAEYHARELARAMGSWADLAHFQITIKAMDPEQPLAWRQEDS